MTRINRRRKRYRQRAEGQCPRRPPLRLTPYTWSKLLRLRDEGPTEVGAFGISNPQDLLLVEDLQLVKQRCTPVTVCFDDQSVADYFDAQVDLGRRPEQFARIWIHTHPGSSPLPSLTDEETFERCFGSADWALMFIVARSGDTYARLRFGTGPGGQMTLPVEIDFRMPFGAADGAAWETEYQQAVLAEPALPPLRALASRWDLPRPERSGPADPWLEEVDSETLWEPVNAPF